MEQDMVVSLQQRLAIREVEFQTLQEQQQAHQTAGIAELDAIDAQKAQRMMELQAEANDLGMQADRLQGRVLELKELLQPEDSADETESGADTGED